MKNTSEQGYSLTAAVEREFTTLCSHRPAENDRRRWPLVSPNMTINAGLGILRLVFVLLSELDSYCTRWCFQRSTSKQQLFYLGWSSDCVNVHVDALWKALNMKALSPVKVMEKMALCPAT